MFVNFAFCFQSKYHRTTFLLSKLYFKQPLQNYTLSNQFTELYSVNITFHTYTFIFATDGDQQCPLVSHARKLTMIQYKSYQAKTYSYPKQGTPSLASHGNGLPTSRKIFVQEKSTTKYIGNLHAMNDAVMVASRQGPQRPLAWSAKHR